MTLAPSYSALRPPVPETLEEAGLSPALLIDLLLKTLYVQGARTGQQLVEIVCLPFALIDERLLELQQRRFVEIRGTKGHGRGGYVFELSSEGRMRAREALASSQYVGPAPVTLAVYRTWTLQQSIIRNRATREMVREGFRALVLEETTLEMLGPAVNSATSLFLYGAPGNGKTYISETIAGLLGGDVYIPYAIEVEGQIVALFDPVCHHRITAADGRADEGADERATAGPYPTWLRRVEAHDRRFVRITRPVVTIGGELTLDQLELRYDPYTKIYQAPFQLKSNGGVLIVDDFGRQRVPPRELLNRWIVPLEKRIDFLTLHTSGKFPVPFDALLIFATNLAPTELLEEAFLRRIAYKIHVVGPDRWSFEEIFRRCCVERDITFAEEAVDYIYSQYYERLDIAPRKCHPRDILDHLLNIAGFLQLEPRLTTELLDRACQSYFVDAM